MQVPKKEPTWDFSPVHSLLNNLSRHDVSDRATTPLSTPQQTNNDSNARQSSSLNHENHSLGNFDRLWDYLGVQRDVPPQTLPSYDLTSSLSTRDKDAYTSDGAINYPKTSRKSVHYETDVGALEDTRPEKSSNVGLTPNQKRKQRRRRAAERIKGEDAIDNKSSESEEEIDIVLNRNRSATASKADQVVRPATVDFSGLKEARESLAKAITDRQANAPAVKTPSDSKSKTPLSTTRKSDGAAMLLRPSQVTPSKSAKSKFQDNSETLDEFLKSKGQLKSSSKTTKNALQSAYDVPWPTTRTSNIDGTADSGKHEKPPTTPKQQKNSLPFPTIQTQPQSRKQHAILPLQANAVDRHWQLLMKLLNNFPDERPSLLSPLQLSINRTQASGIHVFVDASNILIGFYNKLKVSRGYAESDRVPRPDLAFHALALLLERRRSIAKRVLVGSTPELPAFEQAREVGYETCILDKVWKARELTERQRRFASSSHGGNDGTGSSDNATDTAGLITKRPKWVEQGVDEILHLKILESVIDTPSPKDSTWQSDRPAPTMVLATGDAAEAEYSQGFKKMVERALNKGWKVELACWGMSVSMEYKRMAKKGVWGEQFKIIELDDYSEELFGESV